jgi:hypothetical protein
VERKGNTYDDSSHNSGNQERKVNLHIRKQNEPFIPRALFELSRAFSAAYAAGWVFAADAWIPTLNQSKVPTYV